ncbi:hypothetical protein BGZ99_008700 [Dissophora globulifera]|uniref:Thioredoxin domain-containing protein n=1 Tax=Dissophora globulifera TaxID=979702 RepID=A0A9P6RRX9_9FUNG|nr:hypothetical protein BGZ99_008700 [Dissophora globulifera]
MADSAPPPTTAAAAAPAAGAGPSATAASSAIGSGQKAHNTSRVIEDDTLDGDDDVDQSGDKEDDELFEELENDDYGMASFREQRLEELKEEVEKRKLMVENEHGSYKNITDEKEVMDVTTKTKHCVVHFCHSDFRRCMIIDRHLEAMAKKHIKTRFVKIKVEDAPFLVDKLQVRMLPCVISFTDGIAVDRLVGFEELGNTDDFSTAILELRYKTVGVIEDDSKKDTRKMKKKSIFSRDYGSDEGTDDEY